MKPDPHIVVPCVCGHPLTVGLTYGKPMSTSVDTVEVEIHGSLDPAALAHINDHAND